MYKPQPKEEPSAQSNRQKLPPESGCPSMGKVKFMIEEATSRRGCLVELPWAVGDAAFVLTCQWEKTVEEPVWTLYEQENGVASKVVWTQSFAPGDLEFMYDILVMSAPKNSSLAHSQIPDLLRPEHQEEENSWPGPAPETSPYSGSTSAVGMPAMPTGGLPGAGLPGAGLPGGIPSSTGLPGAGLPGGMPGAGLPGGIPGVGLPGGMPGGGMGGGMPGAVPGGPGASYQNLPNVPQSPYGNQPPQSISGQNQQYQGGYQQQMGGYPPPQPPMPNAGYGGYPPQPPQGQTGQYPYGQQMPPMPAPGYPPQPGYAPAPMPAPAPAPQEPMTKMIDYHLLDKRKNLLLGTMLTGAGLISEPTLEAALKLQDLIRDERMSPERAPHVLKRLHAMGGNIDQYLTPDDTSLEPPSLTGAPAPARKPAPPAGKPAGGPPPAPGAAPGGAPAGAKRNLKPAFDLLQTAGILSEEDIKVALEVRKKHGGDLVGILEAASKVSRKTVDAAFICLPLIREGLLKVEQCIIALNYCSRMRVGFDEALDEMGWQNPRKMRSDLPL
ncbi:hypothetical protein KF913_18720 [Candidatus Obscuribacterales bacterium]|nr:hypothetical protein [Candidatus Obscuribacterales bacterium]